jgi:hypothetical protein
MAPFQCANALPDPKELSDMFVLQVRGMQGRHQDLKKSYK